MSSDTPAGAAGADAAGSAASRAGSLRALGQLDTAERVLRDALDQAPGDAGLLGEWAALHQARGDLQQAELAARAAVQAAPDTLPPYLRLVAVLIAAGRAPEARDVTARLIPVAPDVAGLWAQHAIASIDARGRRLPEVRQAYERAIELEPDSPDWYAVGAVCERAHRNSDRARELVVEGLQRAPQHPGLLALRAEYAPVADQPDLLLDLLVTNPGDEESRELLDAAVTWERRAAAAVALVPALVAAVLLAAGPGVVGAVATTVTAVLGAVGAWVVLRRYRRRRDRLPASYLGTLPRRGAALGRWGGVGAAALVVVALALRWASPVLPGPDGLPAALAAGGATVLGLASVVVLLPGDDRVLRTARNRTGRVAWGTAWQFGSLRQELALWSGLAVGVLGIIGTTTAIGAAAPAGLVTAVAWPLALVTATMSVEAFRAGRFAAQRYFRSLGIRYRLFALVVLTAGLIGTGAAGLQVPADRGTSDVPEPVSSYSVPGVPDRTVTPVPVPSFSIPSFDPPTVPPITGGG
ncbi:tetratricopeptide repeat protein [Microbacterium sp. M1A1_1b]